MERISSVVVLEQRFSPPLGSSLRKMLGHAWGISTSDRPVAVVAAVAPRVAGRVVAMTWHESQEVRQRADGGCELRLVIAQPTEIRPWILGWGKECEVVGLQASASRSWLNSIKRRRRTAGVRRRNRWPAEPNKVEIWNTALFSKYV
jgi:predicted DNA-binding transcriptional regulator YafY